MRGERIAHSERPVRVLFVNSGLRFGGAETQLIATIAELKRRGHEPALYLLTRDAPRLAELADLGVPIQMDEKKSKLDFGVIRRLRQFARDWRAELIHGYLFDANIFGRLASIGLPARTLNSERSSGYRLTLSQWAIHTATRPLVAGVVANSYVGCDFAAQMYGLPSDHMHTVWNGIDLAQVDARLATRDKVTRCADEFFPGEAGTKVATLVGTVSRQKDYPLALSVAERLIEQDSRWRVVFVGAAYGAKLAYANATADASNALEREVMARWEASPHRERIKFVGQRRDALEVIASSDVLFSTSRFEGFPNVVLEAMSVGTPVVTTDYSDIKRILPQPECIIDSRDPRDMAAAIIDADRRRGEIAPRSRQWVEQHATIERSVDELLRVYGHYLGAKGAGKES